MILLDNLYTLINSSHNEVVVKLADKEHPIFKAHFPTKPILPGFVQIDIILEILEDEAVEITYTKFIKHICPEDVITYTIKTTAKQKKIIIISDEKKMSEIRYESK